MEASLQILLDETERYRVPDEYWVQVKSQDSSLSLLREEATEVLLHLADAYETSESTLIHSLILMDRFASKVMEKPNAQSLDQSTMTLAAIASFMISAKLREVLHPCIRDMEQLTACSGEQLCDAEKMLISALEWDVNAITGEFCLFVHDQCRLQFRFIV
jgi:hypothetical protein